MNIKYFTVSLGADPEFFFKQEGRVVGAEKVIPKEGVGRKFDPFEGVEYGNPTIIIDGVQAEFNPEANTCRQSFSNNLRGCFVALNESIQGKKVEVDFGASVEVTQTELSSLKKENQTFGCSPSSNAYRDSAITVKDASKYHHRSAGGHIHLGVVDPDGEILHTNPKKVVQMLDILLGNTCVLLDRDPGNIERRKNYGRAGEYRTPKHGLEYRTLSNFWLHCYPLMSFVLGMARFAVQVAADEEASAVLLGLVDMEKIEKAINENDFALAYENFNAIKDVVANIHIEPVDESDTQSYLPLEGSDRVAAFEKFVDKGFKHYFTEDPMTHWLNRDNLVNGWEHFADSIN